MTLQYFRILFVHKKQTKINRKFSDTFSLFFQECVVFPLKILFITTFNLQINFDTLNWNFIMVVYDTKRDIFENT